MFSHEVRRGKICVSLEKNSYELNSVSTFKKKLEENEIIVIRC